MTADPDDRLFTCYHEAAHAIFAYYDDTGIDNVWVSDEWGNCTICRADLYERYQPWEYARFCLAGAYANYVAKTLEHPKLEWVSLDWLRANADRVPEGDAWWILYTLENYVSRDECPFESVEDAYTTLFEEVGELVEERWDEIEAVAFALHSKWLESEQGIERMYGYEVTQIIKSV
jgi:hypothetical protein